MSLIDAGKATQFKKGQSGNPGGRPKGIAALAREHAEKAIDVLVTGLEDRNPNVRIAAARELLDRGYGKPLAMKADVTDKLEDLPDELINEAIEVLRKSIDDDEAAHKHEGSESIN